MIILIFYKMILINTMKLIIIYTKFIKIELILQLQIIMILIKKKKIKIIIIIMKIL